MNLYLVQHGKAASKEVDAARGLTEVGREEVVSVGKALAERDIGVREIRHSGKKRTEETAELLEAHFSGETLVATKPGLAPNDDVRAVIDALENRVQDLMIVGHLPFLSRLASSLLVSDADAAVVAFQNAGVLCLGRDGDGVWRVAWYILPGVG